MGRSQAVRNCGTVRGIARRLDRDVDDWLGESIPFEQQAQVGLGRGVGVLANLGECPDALFCPWNESHGWMNFLSSARVVRLRAGSRHTSESPNSMRSSRDSSLAIWANSASGEVHRSPCTSMVAPEASVLGHMRGMMSFARVRRVVLNVTVAAGRFFVDLKHDRFQNSQIRELFWRKMAVSGFVSASFESVSHGFELSTLRSGASKSVQNLSRMRSTFGNRMGAESVVRIRHRRKALCGAVRMSWAAAAKAHETYGG